MRRGRVDLRVEGVFVPRHLCYLNTPTHFIHQMVNDNVNVVLINAVMVTVVMVNTVIVNVVMVKLGMFNSEWINSVMVNAVLINVVRVNAILVNTVLINVIMVHAVLVNDFPRMDRRLSQPWHVDRGLNWERSEDDGTLYRLRYGAGLNVSKIA